MTNGFNTYLISHITWHYIYALYHIYDIIIYIKFNPYIILSFCLKLYTNSHEFDYQKQQNFEFLKLQNFSFLYSENSYLQKFENSFPRKFKILQTVYLLLKILYILYYTHLNRIFFLCSVFYSYLQNLKITSPSRIWNPFCEN